MKISYQFWTTSYEKYPQFIDLLKQIAAEQLPFVEGPYFREHENFLFVAIAEGTLAGFIRYCKQPIGPEAKCAPVNYKSGQLWEAKINAFAVSPSFRGRGIGKDLQQIVLNHAKESGCYQVASYSTVDKIENYAVKIGLGFGLQLETQPNGSQGAFFIMPLAHWLLEKQIPVAGPF